MSLDGAAPRSPLRAGALLAIVAAVAFGATIPLVHRFGDDVGTFTTASLLYLGAAAATLFRSARAGREAPVRREHLPRVLLVAFAGAVLAPTALAWGLEHADAASASLLLTFEALVTVLFARLFYGEAIGARVWTAAMLMLVGGCALVLGGAHSASPRASWGLVAVVIATIGWSADNTLTRPLADLDPMSVIARKASIGAACTALLALGFRESMPPFAHAAALLLCGATGYGVSLRLYLLAQRRLGVARTGSIFAVAPFIGAGIAWLTGDGEMHGTTWIAGALFAAALYLHLSERHAHVHRHERVEHEHAHRHDDGHHDHVHVPAVEGAHSHRHTHAAVTHEHEHAPDVHHEHRH